MDSSGKENRSLSNPEMDGFRPHTNKPRFKEPKLPSSSLCDNPQKAWVKAVSFVNRHKLGTLYLPYNSTVCFDHHYSSHWLTASPTLVSRLRFDNCPCCVTSLKSLGRSTYMYFVAFVNRRRLGVRNLPYIGIGTYQPTIVHICTGDFHIFTSLHTREIPYSAEHKKYFECGAFCMYGFQDTTSCYFIYFPTILEIFQEVVCILCLHSYMYHCLGSDLKTTLTNIKCNLSKS